MKPEFYRNIKTGEYVLVFDHLIEQTPGNDKRTLVAYSYKSIDYCCEISVFYKLFVPATIAEANRKNDNKQQQKHKQSYNKYRYTSVDVPNLEYKTYISKKGNKYRIYSDGEVFKEHNGVCVCALVPKKQFSGYWHLSIDGESWQLHRLVATVWKPCGDKSLVVDHINNDKDDNSVDNLQWLTIRENSLKGNKVPNKND